MDVRPKTRQVDRERKTPSTQVPRGAKQIVIPMTQQQYDDIWQDADRVRSFIEQCARSAPELFPAGFDQGYCLHGFGRESLKLSGLKLRKIVLANGASYWLRPSFIFSYMTGTVDQLAYPLLLAGLLHHHRKSMNIKELRIWTWVNASDCPARSYAQSVAPGAVSSLLQATYADQEKQRKSCPYKDLCLYC